MKRCVPPESRLPHYTRGSALIGWVKDDAEFIAEQIAARQATDLREKRVELATPEARVREGV